MDRHQTAQEAELQHLARELHDAIGVFTRLRDRVLCCGAPSPNPSHKEIVPMSPEGIRLYDPTAEPRAVAAKLAPRLTTLAGKRVGILDNGKANAGTLMLAVAKILQERYGAGEVVKRDKPVAGPPSPETLEALAQCDFALVGSAD